MTDQNNQQLYYYLTQADPLSNDGIKVSYKRENHVRIKIVHFNGNMGKIFKQLGIKYSKRAFNEYSNRLNLGWTAYGGWFKEVRTK